MSYLDSPRLHFRGWFQADVSTINNDANAFDLSQGQPAGEWNPEGTGIFRILDCNVTGAFLNGKHIGDSTADPIVGMTLQNANQRAPGKLVDLDPQQQMVSMIFGMQIRLVSQSLTTMMQGEFKPAPFTNLFLRQTVTAPDDQAVGAMYQSVLEDVVWTEVAPTHFMHSLRKATQDNKLSIQFNVFGYGRNPQIPRYTMGHIVGTIGPYYSGEPNHFVLGRQMIAQLQNGVVPSAGVNMLQAKVAADSLSVTADFGNAFQIGNANSGFLDIGTLSLGVLTTNPDSVQATVPQAGVVIIGEIPYRNPDWFTQTAAVQTFDLSGNAAAAKYLRNCPLVVVSPDTTTPGSYNVNIQESVGGVYVRSDQFVNRINPGETQTIDFYATQFGAPLAGAAITLSNAGDSLPSGGPQTEPPWPDVAVPVAGVNVPATGQSATITTGPNGHAHFRLQANPDGPTVNGNPWPRGYIAGQLYALGYQLANQPANYVANPWNFISILAYSLKSNPKSTSPTWYGDIQPLLAQFSRLYPIMSKYVVDLADYESVVARVEILKLAFSLPEGDPNHMPVTRDLGAADRAVILQWLGMKGADGKPPLGTAPPPHAVTATSAANNGPDPELLPSQRAGKMAVVIRMQRARRNAALREQK